MKTAKTIAALSASDQGLLQEAKSAILDLMPNAVVLLYGSGARRTRHAGSDYDLLVLSDKPVTTGLRRKVAGALFDVECARGVLLAATYLSKRQWNTPRYREMPFCRNVEREGIVV